MSASATQGGHNGDWKTTEKIILYHISPSWRSQSTPQ